MVWIRLLYIMKVCAAHAGRESDDGLRTGRYLVEAGSVYVSAIEIQSSCVIESQADIDWGEDPSGLVLQVSGSASQVLRH